MFWGHPCFSHHLHTSNSGRLCQCYLMAASVEQCLCVHGHILILICSMAHCSNTTWAITVGWEAEAAALLDIMHIFRGKMSSIFFSLLLVVCVCVSLTDGPHHAKTTDSSNMTKPGLTWWWCCRCCCSCGVTLYFHSWKHLFLKQGFGFSHFAPWFQKVIFQDSTRTILQTISYW